MPTGQAIGFLPKDARVKHGLFGTNWPNFSMDSLFTYYAFARLAGYWLQTLGGGPKQAQQNRYWGVLESMVFGLISLVSFFKEKSLFKDTVYDAIAAERGMKPEDVNIFSMYKSDNPFIRSLRDRFTLQSATRLPPIALFPMNLTAGVLAVTLNYTVERGQFIENSAFDILRNLLYEVQQLRISGGSDKPRTLDGLQRAVQRTLTENHRPILSVEQLQANKEVFERLADNIMNDRFHVAEAVYILGEMANHPGESARLLQEIGKMEQTGIKSFARQKAILAQGKTSMGANILAAKRAFEPAAGLGAG